MEGQINYKLNKNPIIGFPDAVIEPFAVMVELFDAPVTLSTMFAFIKDVGLANYANLIIIFSFEVLIIRPKLSF